MGQEQFAVENITPEMAREWLSQNRMNRLLRVHHVRYLQNQMEQGSWHLNGDPVRFNERGELIDGQHRLAAVLQSGRTVQMLVARNIRHAGMATIDTGLKRQPSDVFRMAGIKNAAVAASMMRWLIAYEHGEWHRFFFSRVSPQVLLGRWEDSPSVFEACVREGMKLRRLTSTGAGAALYFVFRQHATPERLANFWLQLTEGVGIRPGSPMIRLRRRLQANREARRKASHIEQIAWIVKTWNDMLGGRARGVLSFKVGFEDFPDIHSDREDVA